MSEWIEYTGSDEQINIICNAAEIDGVMCIGHDDEEYSFESGTPRSEILQHLDKKSKYQIKQYLIFNPHPLAGMICQQARTGQPVWIKLSAVPNFMHTYIINTCDIVLERAGYSVFVTCKPVWDIPDAEYLLTEFKD